MAWFSPVKGAAMTPTQVDKSLLVDPAYIGIIERGAVITVKTGDNGVPYFTLAGVEGNTDGELYIALNTAGGDMSDTQAEMAGEVMFPGAGWIDGKEKVSASNTAKITGLSLRMSGEYQTDMFDGELADGDKLKVVDGKFVEAGDDDDFVAVCTRGRTSRWVNNAPANRPSNAPVRRQGAMVSVIQFVPAL